jgi:glycosyltransferase involved in cell wall biosynthesis
MKPQISIGMPVYNSNPAAFRKAIGGMLDQSCGDFELILSDNGSDDEHRDLYETAAATDSRIRYIRHATNRGALSNFRFVREQAVAPLFAWAADDDTHHVDFLRRGIETLCPDEVGVAFGTMVVESHDLTQRRAQIDHRSMAAKSPARRLLALCARDYNLPLYGLHRTAVIKRVEIVDSIFADYMMMIGLLAYGRFGFVDDDLFGYSVDVAKEAQRAAQHGVVVGDHKYSDAARAFMRYTQSATRGMSVADRATCIAAVATIVVCQGWWTRDAFYVKIERAQAAAARHSPAVALHGALAVALSPSYPWRRYKAKAAERRRQAAELLGR